MADKSIGTAFVDLKTKVDKKSANNAFQNIGNMAGSLPGAIGETLGKASSLGNIFSKYGEALAGAKAGAGALTGTITVGAGAIGAEVGAMAAIVKKANSVLNENAESWEALETKILTINGLVGGNDSSFDKFKDAIMKVASSTSWSAEQVAEGMESLVRGGASVEQAITSISTVADLARSQVADMGSMADLLSNTRNQFGLTINSVEHIADVIAKSTASSAQNVSDFTEAMKMAGSTAGKMGQSLERTAAQISALANVGIKGSMGGSAINALLSRISGNGSAQKTLQGLGVKTYDESGVIRPLDEIFTDARKAMQEKGLSGEQQNAAWASIAGAENLKSALALSQNYLADIEEELRNVHGTVKEQAAAIDSGLKGSKEILASAKDAITKQLGEAGSDGLKERIDKITEAVGLSAEVAKETAANLERFSNATTGFGDIQGDLEILKQETLNALISAAASICEGLKPITDILHELLSILIDRDKLEAQQIADTVNNAKRESKEGVNEQRRKAAEDEFYNSEEGKAFHLKTKEGVDLYGKEAVQYAETKRNAIAGKQASGQQLSEKEKKNLETFSSFVNAAEDKIVDIIGNKYEGENFYKNAPKEELERARSVREKEKEANEKIVLQYKQRVEAGAYDEKDPYGKAVLDNYSQAVKNIGILNGVLAKFDSALKDREISERKQKEEEAARNAPPPVQETAPIVPESPESAGKKEGEQLPPPANTPPEKPKQEDNKKEDSVPAAPLPEDNKKEDSAPAPAPELKLPETLNPENIVLKIDTSKLDAAANQNTFAHTINPIQIPAEITDPAAIEILKQMNATLSEIKQKPVKKTVKM